MKVADDESFGRCQPGAVKGPALVIVGTYDLICPPSVAYEMHAGIPETQLPELRESGRFGHFEQPDEFAAIMSDFVNNPEMEKHT
ncbi:alpha/beta fold hydrolase [Streptomyces sp. B3I7]|uniref:alpha/beta fold hydrolase n=1 Tax=Streptomyces sp. B3I7 TaxID=3042269 RepID=UPI0027D78E54|nr:hypothetical protein [Streptomyces sp. B3I7]